MNVSKLDLETTQYILHLRNQLEIAEAAIEAFLKERLVAPIETPVSNEGYVLELTDEIIEVIPENAARIAAINADINP